MVFNWLMQPLWAGIGANTYTTLDMYRYTSTNNANPSAGTPVRAPTQGGAV